MNAEAVAGVRVAGAAERVHAVDPIHLLAIGGHRERHPASLVRVGRRDQVGVPEVAHERAVRRERLEAPVQNARPNAVQLRAAVRAYAARTCERTPTQELGVEAVRTFLRRI